jgi:hypothetical protein
MNFVSNRDKKGHFLPDREPAGGRTAVSQERKRGGENVWHTHGKDVDFGYVSEQIFYTVKRSLTRDTF